MKADKEYHIADMRGISFDGSTYASKRTLCDRCGAYMGCNIPKRQASCGLFLPIIGFKPPLRGVDGRFNTIRMGKAWMKRVFPGSRVALLNLKTNEVFGTAIVDRLDFAEKEHIAEVHAKDNHLFVDTNVSPAECGERMPKILRNLYGNLIYKNNAYATAIYLIREVEGETTEVHRSG